MSSKPIQKIQAEALDLPVKDRAHLAHRLLESLDEDRVEDPSAVAEAWDTEIARRVDDYRTQGSTPVPAKEVLGEARRRSPKR